MRCSGAASLLAIVWVGEGVSRKSSIQHSAVSIQPHSVVVLSGAFGARDPDGASGVHAVGRHSPDGLLPPGFWRTRCRYELSKTFGVFQAPAFWNACCFSHRSLMEPPVFDPGMELTAGRDSPPLESERGLWRMDAWVSRPGFRGTRLRALPGGDAVGVVGVLFGLVVFWCGLLVLGGVRTLFCCAALRYAHAFGRAELILCFDSFPPLKRLGFTRKAGSVRAEAMTYQSLSRPAAAGLVRRCSHQVAGAHGTPGQPEAINYFFSRPAVAGLSRGPRHAGAG